MILLDVFLFLTHSAVLKHICDLLSTHYSVSHFGKYVKCHTEVFQLTLTFCLTGPFFQSYSSIKLLESRPVPEGELWKLLWKTVTGQMPFLSHNQQH